MPTNPADQPDKKGDAGAETSRRASDGETSPHNSDHLRRKGNAVRRALVVGINDYAPPNTLPSCISDASRFSDTLRTTFGFRKSDIATLLDGEATQSAILQGLDRLVAGSASPDDRLVLYYSGHGYQRTDESGVKQEYLVPVDQQLIHDEEIIRRCEALPPGVFTLVLDCCFGGGFEKLFLASANLLAQRARAGRIVRHSTLPELLSANAIDGADEQTKGRIKTFIAPDLDQFIQDRRPAATAFKGFGSPERMLVGAEPFSKDVVLDIPSSGSGNKRLNGILFSACTENETASASTPLTDGMSAFTFALCRRLAEGGNSWPCDSLAQAVAQSLRTLGIQQTPQLKGPAQPPNVLKRTFIEEADPRGQPGAIPHIGPVYQSSVLQGLFRSILSDPSAAQVDGQSLYKLSSKEDAMDLTALLPLLLGANTQKAAPQKNFVTDILPIFVQLISALAQRSTQSNAKALAGNDAMLLPTMLATMLNAARQPDPSAQKSIGADPLSALLPTLLPLLLKGRADQPASQKLFGIDDAILIPAIVSLVTAATKQAQAPAQAETKRFDFNSLLPVITPILQSKAQELAGQDNRSMIDNALFIPAVAAVMSAAVHP